MDSLTLPDDFSRFAGELAESFSFNRSVGQIYGLLFIHASPLSLDDISAMLKMSKGNASINLRTLESWGAIRSVSVSGSRRDHYEANQDVKGILVRRVREGLSRRLEMAETSLSKLSEHIDSRRADPAVLKRIKELKNLVQRSRRALNHLPKIAAFL
ncbi:MAG: hypothetical protein AAB229_01755 [Candidatus Hydrogenedentota bacterium]